ncbi:MAG TPA: nucleotidyltransferase domain-containing protein [Candidatus Nanoarchaeia archaeon]|nr:nucleotidyltransferase domain-containing protein [Candidatus Nanoarchaeia archaeon]
MESRIINTIRKLGGSKIQFIILFGSLASGKNNKFSDIDLAIYFEGDKKEKFDFIVKLAGMLPDKYDIKIFQDLPLYIQKDVFKGKLIYAKNKSFAYDVAYKTIKRFEDFKKGYYDYINLERIR